MKTQVVLCHISENVNQIQLPMGIGVLINALKLNNLDVELIDLVPIPIPEREKYFLSRLPKTPCIYGFSIIIGNKNILAVDKYAKMVHNINPLNKIVYGGPLPSAVPELLLKNCMCDYVIKGEGEIVFPKLVKSLLKEDFFPNDISGLFYIKDGKIVGKQNDMIRQLDKYSEVDYSLFNIDFYLTYLRETNQSFEIMASRGCRYNCSFCFKTCGTGMSFKTPDSVLDEIEMIMKNYNMNKFYFVDENFFTDKSFFKSFVAKKKERNLNFTFIVQSRIDSVDRDILKLAKSAGLTKFSTAIESVNQNTLNKIKKGTNINDIEAKLNLFKEFEIQLFTDFIFGFPWDTPQSFHDIISFVKKHNLHKRFKLSYYTPLPSTQLWTDVVSKGLIKDEYKFICDMGDLYWERMINLTTLPDDILDYYYNKVASIGRRLVDYPKDEKYLIQMKEVH